MIINFIYFYYLNLTKKYQIEWGFNKNMFFLNHFKNAHLLMTLILGPMILLPKASRSAIPPRLPVIVFAFILLLVFRKSFLEFIVLVIIVGGLLVGLLIFDDPLFVNTLFLLTDGYLLVGWMYFFYFYTVTV